MRILLVGLLTLYMFNLAPAATLSPEALETLTDYLLETQKRNHIPTLGFALVESGDIRFEAASSIVEDKPVGIHTRIPAPALTEPLTSLFTAILAQSRSIELDTPAVRLDERFDTSHADNGRTITLEQLLGMNAGLPSYLDNTLADDRLLHSDLFPLLRQSSVENAPGTQFVESQTSVATAGLLLASASGYPDDYPSAICHYLFEPLGMNDSTVANTPLGPANGLETSLHDLAQWLCLETRDGLLSDGTRLANAFVLRRRYSPLDLPEAKDRTLGWFEQYYQGTRIIGRGGSAEGYTLMLTLLPEEHIGFAFWAASENDAAHALPGEINLALVELLRESQAP